MSKSKIFFYYFGCQKKKKKKNPVRIGVKWSSIAQGPTICHASDVIFIKVYWKRNG